MDRAIFGTKEGEILVGHGPFTSSAEPPPSGVAFYKNDFALSDPEPWRVPSRFETLRPPKPSTLEIAWEEPDAAAFSEIFREVSDAITRGVIDKSVPVATAIGHASSGGPDALLQHLFKAPRTLRPYGWIGQNEGFLGATPEVLFRLFDGRVYTMALAGTARSEEAGIFAVDHKEIREHEFVAQTLIAKLSDLGMVRKKEREIIDLGPLIHFQTLIEVELYQHQLTKTLIERLHPTPALGPLPRTQETMSLLTDWRDRLGCPPSFGAPFGLIRDGEFEALVAIRMIAWEGSQYKLPSGCGVIEESRLVNEWRELSLKRTAVRELLLP